MIKSLKHLWCQMRNTKIATLNVSLDNLSQALTLDGHVNRGMPLNMKMEVFNVEFDEDADIAHIGIVIVEETLH